MDRPPIFSSRVRCLDRARATGWNSSLSFEQPSPLSSLNTAQRLHCIHIYIYIQTRLINKILMILERAYIQITTLTRIIRRRTFRFTTPTKTSRGAIMITILAAPPLPPRNIRDQKYTRRIFSPHATRIRSVYIIPSFIAHSLGFAINRRPRNMRTNDDIEASDDNPRRVQLARFHRTCRSRAYINSFFFLSPRWPAAWPAQLIRD